MSNDNIRFWKGGNITSMTGNNIFVFGSNPEGRHGAGAAKAAMNFGAEYGNGRGLQGNTYALVTKNLTKGFYEESTGTTYDIEGERSITPEQISANIDELYECARNNPELKFFITYQKDPNTKNLNGYSDEEMFDLFIDNKEVPENIRFHESFKPLYQQKKNQENKQQFTFFWGAESPFSQWHPSVFQYKDKTFISAEQFMMYSKAKLFGDDEVADKIMHYNNSVLGKEFIAGNVTGNAILKDDENNKIWRKIQKKIKDLGKEVSVFDEETWKQKREPIVTVGNREKYTQNPDLFEALKNTVGTRLVEASNVDKESTEYCVVQVLLKLKKDFENNNKETNKSRNRPK